MGKLTGEMTTEPESWWLGNLTEWEVQPRDLGDLRGLRWVL